MEKNKRIIYIDVLKILASIAVVIIHVATSDTSSTPFTYEWNILNFFNSISRWCVPVFIMASGVVFLSNNKEVTIKNIWVKYIKRIAITFVIWSTIYSITYNVIFSKNINFKIIKDIFCGHFHLWYLKMAIGLYIITPFLKKLTTDKKLIQYFLVIWFIAQICLGMCGIVPIYLQFVMGYSGYFILGHYLNTYKLSNKNIKVVYVLGIIGLFVTIIGTSIIKKYSIDVTNKNIFYEYLSPNVLFMSMAIFIFIKRLIQKISINISLKKIIEKWSSYLLGIYVIHILVLEVVMNIKTVILQYSPILTMLIIPLIVYSISTMLVIIISKVPVLKSIV